MKKSAVIFGAGAYWLLSSERLREQYNVVALLDNDASKRGTVVGGLAVAGPDEIGKLDCDIVVVTPIKFFDVILQLHGLGVPDEKFRSYVPGVSFFARGGAVEAVKDSVRLRLTQTYDSHVWSETFLSEVYGGFFGENATVIDIGMNIGDAALFMANMDWVGKVFAFEPFPVYEQAIGNIALNPRLSKKIAAFNYGITGGKSGREENLFYDPAASIASTVYTRADSGGIAVDMANATEALAPIVSEARAGRSPILLKVDAEGSEFGILRDLHRSGLLRGIDTILMEVHLYREPGGLRELQGILRQSGFRYSYNPSPSHLHGLLFAFNAGGDSPMGRPPQATA
ncbi:MAG: FkbM family methyltransferase [Clostridiales bacterium]|nr:FkbM family methyltransferase [Clostridiales bacterium]